MWRVSSRVSRVVSRTRSPLLVALLRYRLYCFVLAWLAGLLLCNLKPAPLAASALAQTSNQTTVFLLTFAGPVTPVLESYLSQAIREAEQTAPAVIILQLDTPGGS